MHKKVSLFLILALLVGLLSACGTAPASKEETSLSVVTTIFPIYDWTRVLLADQEKAEVTMLLDSGVDLHSFQPTTDDIMTILNCDLFIYVGGESDEWVEDVLSDADDSVRTLNLMEALGDAVKEEETVEGMEPEDDEEEADAPEMDEHVWLSLRNAEAAVQTIAGALTELDASLTDSVSANCEGYLSQLRELDAQYQQVISGAKYDTLVFGDRFPFRYLADDYGLQYYAAFSGCSAETEASFETVLFLAEKLNALGLPAVMQIETSDGSIARSVRDASLAGDQAILTLNSLQSVTAKDVQTDVSYLAAMQENLAVLEQALN